LNVYVLGQGVLSRVTLCLVVCCFCVVFVLGILCVFFRFSNFNDNFFIRGNFLGFLVFRVVAVVEGVFLVSIVTVLLGDGLPWGRGDCSVVVVRGTPARAVATGTRVAMEICSGL